MAFEAESNFFGKIGRDVGVFVCCPYLELGRGNNSEINGDSVVFVIGEKEQECTQKSAGYVRYEPLSMFAVKRA